MTTLCRGPGSSLSDSEATSTPSPSTVAYLFADRFVLTAQPGKTGMKAFGTGDVVVSRRSSAVGRLTGRSSAVLQGVPDRLAELRPRADELAAQWRDVRKGPAAEIVKLLRSTTYDGIQVRAQRSRDRGD